MENLVAVNVILAFLALLEALHSLRGGARFAAMLRQAAEADADASEYAPPATLIIPCRGVDPGLEENLRAYFSLYYPDLQLVVAVDDPQDPCLQTVQKVQREFPEVASQVVCAGEARGRGQKVHNLLHALGSLRPQDEIIAFGDSDIRPGIWWLRDLAGTLEDPEAGMATGFRWYVPLRGNFASLLRSVWNAGAVSLMKEKDNLFAWGGAMAIRRSVFEECQVRDHWQNALSDDLALSRALRERGRSIHFQPKALSFSHEDCSLEEFLAWSRRQMAILRVYCPRLWRMALLAQTLNSAALWGGALVLAANWGRWNFRLAWLVGLLTAVYLLGCAKGMARAGAVSGLFPNQARAVKRYLGAYTFWGPLASLASLLALIRSGLSRDVEWRGIRYRMLSPDRTEVLGRKGSAGKPQG